MKISTSVRFGIALGLAMVAALACGDDDDSPSGGSPGAGGDGEGGASAGGEGGEEPGAGGEGGEEPGAGGEGGTPGEGGEGGEPAAGGMGQGGGLPVNPCDPTSVDTGAFDCPELLSCLETECQGAYQTCLGDDYLNGDFTGGTCEEYMTCASECGSAEDCDTDCAAACEGVTACNNCLANTVGLCAFTSCQAEFFECGLGAGGAGFGGSGFGGSGFGGFGGAAGGGCTELEACCTSLEGADQTACNMALDAAMSIDIACGVILSGYQAAEQC